MKWIPFLIFLLIPFWGRTQIITTIAGTGSHSYTGNGGLADTTAIGQPYGCAVDAYGNFYFSEGGGAYPNLISKITPCGTISTAVGTGVGGYNGDGILATAAKINGGGGIAFDSHNNMYIADVFNNRIRKVDVITGIITTVVGNGFAGFRGDGGLADTAELNEPENICFDRIGNLYIIDGYNYRIRKVDTFGIITTFAGNGTPDYYGDNGPATAAEIDNLYGICADTSGNIYFEQQIVYVIRKIDTAGIITTIAGNGTPYVTGDGGPATTAGIEPFGLAFDRSGNLFISGFHENDVRKINSSGIIYTVAGDTIQGFSGDGGSATAAEINVPYGIAVDPSGNLFIADAGNSRIRKVTFNPVITPTIIVTTSPNDTVCTGTSVTFTAAVSGTSASFTYQWLVNGISVSGGTAATYTYSPANGDSIQCTISVTGQCAIISSNTIYIVASPPATPTISLTATTPALVGSTVTVNATVAGASSSYSINWYNNGMLFSTTSTPSTTYIKDTGTDNIMATVIPSPLGTLPACYDSTTSSIFSISATTGISNIASPPLNIYPNPAHDVLHIDNVSPQTTYSLLSMVGTVLQKDILHTGNNSIIIQSFPPGIYILQVTNPTGAKTITKIVKE